jgi:hypothetical protein
VEGRRPSLVRDAYAAKVIVRLRNQERSAACSVGRPHPLNWLLPACGAPRREAFERMFASSAHPLDPDDDPTPDGRSATRLALPAGSIHIGLRLTDTLRTRSTEITPRMQMLPA